MGKIIRRSTLFIISFILLLNNIMIYNVKAFETVNDISDNVKITYQVSLKGKGWQGIQSDGEKSNIPVNNNPIEQIKINYDNKLSLKLKYQVYDSISGWQKEADSGQETGIKGQTIEGIKINILNNNFQKQQKYSVYYRVYDSKDGWLNWNKDGQVAGLISNNQSIESIEICVAEKDTEKYKKMEFLSNDYSNNSLIYRGHSAYIGTQKSVQDSELAGITGKGLGLQAIRIYFNNNSDIAVKYQTYVQDNGWQNEVENGSLSGTEGKGKALQAIKITLKDSNNQQANDYTIHYRVHLANTGWQNWVKNGEIAGKEKGNQIEAIQIYVEKNITNDSQSINYSTHVQNIGTQKQVKDGEIAGTVGKGLRMEAIKINYQNSSGFIVKYRTHVSKIGWQNYKKSGEVAGTEGKSLAIEAIEIYLEDSKGNKVKDYSIYYRAHVADYGWQQWVSNNKQAGTTGKSKAIQAIQICVVKNKTSEYYKMEDLCNANNEDLVYKVHASRVGWESNVKGGNIAGSTRSIANNLEAIEAYNLSSIGLRIQGQAHVSKIGWSSTVVGNHITIGTVGRSLSIEAVKFNLVDESGNNPGYYSIYYRVYTGSRWLAWTKDGMQAGTTGKNLPIKAIQIVIRKVGTNDCISMNRQVNYAAASHMPTISNKASVPPIYVTKNQLIALGWKNVNDKMINECNDALRRFGITTPARIRHFISQCSYESGLGRYTKELSSGNAYEGRKDLGNVYCGDGPKYKGAGYIQVTGRSNYQRFCNFIKDSRVMQGCSFVSQRYPWTISAYWWYSNNINYYVDRGASVTDITRRVNGGIRGLSERTYYYNRCCSIFR